MDDPDVASLHRDAATTGGFLVDNADDLRISIAGAQEKTALLWRQGRWHRPRGAMPTTHILKLPLGLVGNFRANMLDSVENEWLCLRFLREVGFPVANAEIAEFRDEVSTERVLVVERFDRVRGPGTTPDSDWIVRLPQEDFCQALGTPAREKYESDGGPGIREGLALLANSDNRDDDALVFAKVQLAFWLLAAPDGHAKNFSIFLQRGGRFIMTPLYDVLSAWPIIGHGPKELPQEKVDLAMGLRGKHLHRRLNRISIAHWRTLSAQTGVPDAFVAMVRMVEEAGSALERVASTLPSGFPEHVFFRISRGVQAQRARFLKTLQS